VIIATGIRLKIIMVAFPLLKIDVCIAILTFNETWWFRWS